MREYPSAPIAGVGAVIWKGEQVLLVQRGHAPRAGTWSLPGGMQCLGETVHEAVIREITEETALAIRILDVAAVVDLMDRDGDGRIRYHYTVIDVVAEWAGGEARAGDDAADVAWVGPARYDELGVTDDVRRVIALAAVRRHADAPPALVLPDREVRP